MRKNLFLFFLALFALIGLATAPAMAQDCQVPQINIGDLVEVSAESLYTRQTPSTDAVLSSVGGVHSGDVVQVLKTVQIGCDLWIDTAYGYLGAYVNGVQNLQPATGSQAQAAAAAPQALVNDIVAGAMSDGIGFVQLPQLDQTAFNLLAPEGGIAFFAEEIQEKQWHVVAVVGSVLTDDDHDDGAILPITGFDPAKSVAAIIFRNENSNETLISAFVAELFQMDAESVGLDVMHLDANGATSEATRTYRTAPRSIYSFEFANPTPQVFEAQLERLRPQGSGTWDDRENGGTAGWNFDLQRLGTVIGATGFSNWFAGDRLDAELENGTELNFESAGEKGEHIVFFTQSAMPITLVDFNQGTSSFTALVGGNESLDFTIQNVSTISMTSNCGDGCDLVIVTLVDTDTGIMEQERFTRATLTQHNIDALIERFEIAAAQG